MSRLRFAAEYLRRSASDSCWILADDLIRSFRGSDGPFCVFAQCKTGNPQRRRFLLDAAGVGKHEPGMTEQTNEVEISHRGNDTGAVVVLRTQLIELLLRPRVNRKDDRDLRRHSLDRAHEILKRFDGINVGGPVQRQYAEWPKTSLACQAKLFPD